MLEKISKGILKYKGIVILVFSILLAITIVGTVFLVISDDKINSDMVSYLDDDSTTKLGILPWRRSMFIIMVTGTPPATHSLAGLVRFFTSAM